MAEKFFGGTGAGNKFVHGLVPQFPDARGIKGDAKLGYARDFPPLIANILRSADWGSSSETAH